MSQPREQRRGGGHAPRGCVLRPDAPELPSASRSRRQPSARELALKRLDVRLHRTVVRSLRRQQAGGAEEERLQTRAVTLRVAAQPRPGQQPRQRPHRRRVAPVALRLEQPFIQRLLKAASQDSLPRPRDLRLEAPIALRVEHRARAAGAHAHDGVVARLTPEQGPLEPALQVVGTARHPGRERDDGRGAAARQGGVLPGVVLEDDVQDYVAIRRIGVVSVGPEVRRAHVQLHIAANGQAGGSGDRGAAKIRSRPAPRSSLGDHADGHAGTGHQRAVGKASAAPDRR
jgi:hypothetical protein